MAPEIIGVIGFVSLLLLIAFRVPVAIAMGIVGLVGGYIINGPDSIGFILGATPFETVFPYGLSVVPLFILMGAFATHAGLSGSLYKAIYTWIGHFRGGLAIATVGACGAFGAICGSSLATAATMTKVSMPEMRKRGYDEGLASASIAAGGTLGVLIPPSIIIIIYAILTEASIGKLFAAALLPGCLAVILYMLAISIRTWLNPALGPRGERRSWGERIAALVSIWHIVLLFVLVIGGIYVGWFSPTEAASVGVFGAFFLALTVGRIGLGTFLGCLKETAATSGMIFLILIGTAVFNFFIETTMLPTLLADWIVSSSLSPMAILLCILLFYVILGCFMDSLSMILLTLPVLFPVVQALNFDVIWFGIVVLSVVEIGLITPPVGMNLFVIMAAYPEVRLKSLYLGVIPFLLADVVRVTLLILFPALTLWLPSLIV
ncbi:TRAP transporter large permease [Marinobacterium lutimaris]|uniref:TRAP transporter large permease protein n=1 Tax=Marinobacterium lutimaris TaxID=568106 RepID=A0A1H5V2I3_9GAMM|nr:TRAP transporter large permease [Marinobacterium lutimaris]SEF80627.1 TRAP transporter, DctM subunit [Marinobacterium lutimaris]